MSLQGFGGFGGCIVGLTIHFEKTAPDALELWLSSEARYIIGAFGKAYDLEKIYGARTNAIISECKQRGEKVVGSITMVLDADMKRLDATLVRLQNGDSFLIDEKYRLVESAETRARVAELLENEDSPRVFTVTNK
jgi:hypothetical protein